MLPQARTVTVVALENHQTTENGNTYSECRIEGGRLMVWGQQHAAWLAAQRLPFVAAIFCIPDRQEKGLFWVPERAEMVLKELPERRLVG